MNNDVERVRDASDIVRVVGEHVALKAKGREFVGLCPFHDDHSPSMYVVPAKGIFHCFVCGAGGDVFGFVKRFYKMEFREALEYLADKFSVTLTPFKPAGRAESEDGTVSRQDLLRACAVATEYFRAILRHPEHGHAARAVVERRGISPEMVEQFAVGASAARWDGLLKLIESKGLDRRAFSEAGLLKARDSGGEYDAFRNRLMFPIHDAGGRVIAFGGRKIDEADEPKYLNSPETRLFNKSKTLYGYYQASRSIQAEKVAVITEGYTDTIACHQAGITNVVATLGTALTRDHAALLRRVCSTVILMFDGDDAGQRAADRAVEVFFSEPLDVKIATLAGTTDAKDPDELLKRPDGAAVLREVFANASDLLEYRFRRLRARVQGNGPAAMSQAISADIDRLIELGLADVDPVRQKLVVRGLARVAGIDERDVMAQVRSRGAQVRRAAPASVAVDGPDQAVTVELHRLIHGVLSATEHALACVLLDGSLWKPLAAEHRELLAPGVFEGVLTRQIAALIAEQGASGAVGLRSVLDLATDENVRSAATALAARVQRETEDDSERLHRHWEESLKLAWIDAHNALAKGSEGLSLAQRLEFKRQQHQSVGGDRRILPRPSS